MAAIRGRDTKPELLIRRAMHAAGLRYRLHSRHLAGRPDLVFAQHRAVIFVNGCFWHQHNCHLFKWPGTRQEFWHEKIRRNVMNDHRVLTALGSTGWRVAVVWECSLKGRTKLDEAETMHRLASWVRSDEPAITIQGARSD